MVMTGADIAHSRVLGEWLRSEAEADPAREFVNCGGEWLTLAEVNSRSDALAAGLQAMGITRSERVAILLPNCLEYVLLVFGIAKAGAVQVPINTFLRGEFLRHQLDESGAVVLVTDATGLAQVDALLPALPALSQVVLVGPPPAENSGVAATPFTDVLECTGALVEPSLTPDDLCVIMYTSGTTGPSKGCMISHGYYCSIPLTFVEYGWFQPGDRIYGASPMFHFTGQVTIVANALAARGSAVLDVEFHASTFMARAREVGATALFGVGAMALAVLAQPVQPGERDHHIRTAMWIPMTPAAQQTFSERFGIATLCEIYGQSECWPVTLIRADAADRNPAALGRALPHFELRLVDDDDRDVPTGTVGEIIVRSTVANGMFGGYFHNPEASAAAARNGWHHTGDHAVLDEEGMLYFKDRKKDSLRRRGENVSSMELERALLAHPAIAAVAVHAVDSELSEDEIKACIVLAPGASLSPSEFFDFARSTVPYYAIPRYLEVLDELPLTPTLRVEKHRLRARGVTPATADLEALGLVVSRDDRRKV